MESVRIGQVIVPSQAASSDALAGEL